MQNKVLTISIAAYNVEDYIEECLAPFGQEDVLERCEILIIDDGSTDKTRILAEKYEKDFPNTFKVIHKENGGWGSTVNCGISLARGKYFKQLDGDDYFLNVSLSSFLDILEKTEVDIVVTPFLTFISNTKQIVNRDNLIERFGIEEGKIYKLSELNQNMGIEMHHCTFKTSVLQENSISLLEHAFYTDTELVIKALCYSNTVAFVPMTVYCYRVQRAGQSMSKEGIRKHYKEHERVVFRIADFLRKQKSASGYKLAIYRQNEIICAQYIFYTMLQPNRQHFHELKEYDRKLKTDYPEFYRQRNSKSKRVKLLRGTKLLAYYPLCLIQQ